MAVPVTKAEQRPEPRNALSQALFWVKVSRPGLWSTAAWFYLLPVGRQDVFASWMFWVGLFYFTFPFGFLLYGWNDIGDQDTDRINPRKGNFLFGARGTGRELARLPRCIALVQVPFVVLFVALEGPRFLLWFTTLLLANVLYNTPPFRFKGRPPLDLANQVGYLLVFVLSSWLNDVPQLPWSTFLFGALFAMHAHLFGQILDIVPDRKAGRRTTASVLGVRRSKLLLIGVLAAESLLTGLVFRSGIIAGFLALSALWFVLDLTVLWGERQYTTAQARLFAQGLNVVALGSMPWVWASGALTRLP